MLRSLSQKKALDICIIIIPILYQAVMLYSLPSRLMYLPILVVCLINLVSNKFYLERTYSILGGCVLFTYVVCSILSFEFELGSTVYLVLIFLFYLAIPSLGERLAKNSKFLFRWILLSNTIILLPTVLSYFPQISASQIMSSLTLTDGSRYDRLYFGFSHPNTAAIMITTEIIIIIRNITIEENKKINALYIILCSIFFVALLATGSRTAALSVLVFFVMYLLCIVGNKMTRGRIFLWIVVIILIGYTVFSTDFIYGLFSNSSGRDSSLTNLISALTEKNRMLFGVSVGEISSGHISSVLGSKIIVDSWYMYMFASTGVVGLIVIVAGLIYFFKNMISVVSANDKSFAIAMTIFFMCYGLAENTVFVPGVLLSIVGWMIIYSLFASSYVEPDKDELE